MALTRLYSTHKATSTSSHNTDKNAGKKVLDKDRMVTLIDINGKLVGQLRYEEAMRRFREQQAQTPKDRLELLNVDLQKGVYKISQVQKVQVDPNTSNGKKKDSASSTDTAIKKEKEFKLSDSITEHDLKVKMNQMHLVLSKGHPVRITLARKKRKFSLFGTGPGKQTRTEEEQMLENVIKELKDVAKVVLPIREQSNGQSWLTVLAPLMKPPTK